MQVVRVVMTLEETGQYGRFLDAMAQTGNIVMHRNDETGCCFDVVQPVFDKPINNRDWAYENARVFQDAGFNAVSAPEMKG